MVDTRALDEKIAEIRAEMANAQNMDIVDALSGVVADLIIEKRNLERATLQNQSGASTPEQSGD